jgi:hypothetical protein
MVNEMNCLSLFKSILFRSLGLSLLLSPPASTPSDLQILNSVWKVVTKFKDPAVSDNSEEFLAYISILDIHVLCRNLD